VERRGSVKVDVYTAAGRRVGTLFGGTRDAGTHTVEWDGRDGTGSRAASGIYFVRVAQGEDVRTARVVHLK
jgi:flagellar hook assembly protein FlgD